MAIDGVKVYVWEEDMARNPSKSAFDPDGTESPADLDQQLSVLNPKPVTSIQLVDPG